MNILEKNLEIRSLDSGKFKYDQKVIKTAPNVFYETIIENNIVTSNGVVYNNIEYENTPLVSINRQPLSTSTETNKKVKSLTFSIDKTLLYNIDKGIFELTPI
jgi:hypothetical protein